jgi:hypothetical protein
MAGGLGESTGCLPVSESGGGVVECQSPFSYRARCVNPLSGRACVWGDTVVLFIEWLKIAKTYRRKTWQ